MSAMLTLQRRHSKKCQDKDKGPNYLKCRGHCPLRVGGMLGSKRVRKSLKTRDVQRAARRKAEMEEEAPGALAKPSATPSTPFTSNTPNVPLRPSESTAACLAT